MQNKQIIYSLIALIVIIVIIGGSCLYYISNNQTAIIEYKQTSKEDEPTIIELNTPKVIEKQIDIGEINFNQYFTSNTPSGNEVSNVVGYFAGGAFLTYVPQWMADNWMNDSSDNGNMTIFTTKSPSSIKKDFSDIVIKTQTTDETFNAEWLFQNNKKGALVSEVILNTEGDMVVYHTEKQNGEYIEETFYIDGTGKTGVFTFSASQENYYKYNTRVKEFIQGLRKSGSPRG